MAKIKTEADAWREIGRRIETGIWDRHGLCAEINIMGRFLPFISYEMSIRMQERILSAMNETPMDEYYEGYIFPRGEYPEARAMLAYTFALEAEGKLDWR